MGVERVGAMHPECCQANTGNGSCQYRQEKGSQFCSLHGGGATINSMKREESRNFQLQGVLAERARRMGNSTQVKSLADEIGMMRAVLESIFNGLKDTQDVLLYSDKLEKLSKTIGDLVERWQKLQERNKELLGREDVMRMFDLILEKIILKVEDPDVIRILAEEGYAIIAGRSGGEVA